MTTGRLGQAGPGFKARVAGALWLVVIATGSFAVMATSGLIVQGDPATTAGNIVTHETLLRASVLADLIAASCYLGVTILLFELLSPVSLSLSRLAAAFGIGGVAFASTTLLTRVAPLILSQGDDFTGALTTIQMQAMSYVALKLYGFALYISLVLFGVQCFIVGYLITRSRFLPRTIGILLAIGGLGYIVGSFTNLLSPTIGAIVANFVMPAALLGEGSVTAWLLLRGVDVSGWENQASDLPRP